MALAFGGIWAAAPSPKAYAQPGWHAAAATRAGVTDNSASVASGQSGSVTDAFAGLRVEGGYERAHKATEARGTYNAALNVFPRDSRTSVIQTATLESETRLSSTVNLGFRLNGQYGLIGDMDTLISPGGGGGGQGTSFAFSNDDARPSGAVRMLRGAAADHLLWRISRRWTLDQRLEVASFSPSGPNLPLQASNSGTSDNIIFTSWPRQGLGLRVRGDALRTYSKAFSGIIREGADRSTLLTTAFFSHRFTPIWEGQAEAGPMFLFGSDAHSKTTHAGRLALQRTGWNGSGASLEFLRAARPNPLMGDIFITDRISARYSRPLRKFNGVEMLVEGGLMRQESLPSIGNEPSRVRVAYATTSVGYGLSRHLSISVNYQLRVQRNPSDLDLRFPSYTRNLFFVSLEGRIPAGPVGAGLEP